MGCVPARTLPAPSRARAARSRGGLLLFRHGDSEAAEVQFQPNDSLSGKVSFHVRNHLFSNWLTHNAGSRFNLQEGPDFNADRVDPELPRYVWDQDHAFSAKIAESNLLVGEVRGICQREFGNVVDAFNSDPPPPGGTATFQIENHEPKPVDCLDLEPQCQEFNRDPDYRVMAFSFLADTDLFLAVARFRLVDHELGVTVRNAAEDAQSPPLLEVVAVESRGRADDLTEFNVQSEFPAPAATVMQLGHSGREPVGRISLASFEFLRSWDTNDLQVLPECAP